jgi:hypothetical protein
MTTQTSVAAEVGTVKRALQMNMFAGKKDHDEVTAKNSDTFKETEEGKKLFADAPGGKFTKTVGQVIGQIFDVQEREGQLRDGTPTKSLLAIGEFEAAVYSTGEIMESYTAYLPKYFLETCKAALDSQQVKAIPLAIEIVLTPTGKPIPTAYEIRNLMRKRPDSVMNQIKAELQGMSRLRVSGPVAAPAPAVLGIEDASDLPAIENGDPDHVPEGEQPSPEADAKAPKGGKRQTAE